MLVATSEVIEMDGGKHLCVEVHTTADVDRKRVYGWMLKATPSDQKLAAHLIQAIHAGKALTVGGILTDVNGKTYLNTNTMVTGRTMNADLKRLGF